MAKMCSLSKKMRGTTDCDSYISLMDNPKYLCKRCGRVSNEKENLCRPFPMAIIKEICKEENKVKEVEIAVRRDGIEKHYVQINEEAPVIEEEKLEHDGECDCAEDCGDNCSCKDEEKSVHVSELFKNEDGSYDKDWEIGDEIGNDEIPVKEKSEGKPFEKCLKSGKKDKKLKKLKMSDLRAIIREEVKKALEKK